MRELDTSSYIDTFIQIAPDSKATQAVVPVAKGDKKPQHLIQYELLTAAPYTYNHEELVFAVYVRHQGIDEATVAAQYDELWADLFQKGHPCLRASALTKKYGWGAHYNDAGKIALYAVESPEYQRFLAPDSPTKVLNAMRSKRG